MQVPPQGVSGGEVRVWGEGSEAGLDESKQAAVLLGWPRLRNQHSWLLRHTGCLQRCHVEPPHFGRGYRRRGRASNFSLVSSPSPASCWSKSTSRDCLPHLSERVTWPRPSHQGALQRHRGVSLGGSGGSGFNTVGPSCKAEA